MGFESLTIYSTLFLDGLKASLVFFFQGESAIYAMIIFKKYNPHLIFITSLSAGIFGSIINWFVGKKLQFLKRTKALKTKEAEIRNAEITWDKYLIWALLLSPIKIIGNPFSLLSGFMNSGFKKFLTIIFISKFTYYFWLVYFAKLEL